MQDTTYDWLLTLEGPSDDELRAIEAGEEDNE